jgi:hypothetical protein
VHIEGQIREQLAQLTQLAGVAGGDNERPTRHVR